MTVQIPFVLRKWTLHTNQNHLSQCHLGEQPCLLYFWIWGSSSKFLRWHRSVNALVFFGLPAGSMARFFFEAHLGANTSPPEADFFVESPFSVPTITNSYARIGSHSSYLPLHRPDCALSRPPCGGVRSANDPVTQSIATPEPSSRTITTQDQLLVACWSRECVATPGTRRSCPGWAACLLPWRTPYCLRLRLAWAGIGEDCRPRTTWRPLTLAGSPVLPPMRLTGGFLPSRLDGTAARR